MKTLKSKLMTAVTLTLFILTLIISACFYFSFRRTMIREFSSSRTNSLKLISQEIDGTVKNMNTIADLFLNDNTLASVMTSDSLDSMNLSDVRAHADELYLKYYTTFQNSNLSFYVIVTSENGFQYCSSERNYAFDGIKKTAWHTKYRATGDDSYFLSSYYDSCLERPRYVCAAVRVLRKHRSEYAGTIMVCMDERNLYERYENLLDGGNDIYIIDDMMRVISSPEKEKLGSAIFPISLYSFLLSDDSYSLLKNELISKYKSPYSQWIIVEQMSAAKLIVPSGRILTAMLPVLLMLLPFILLITHFLTKTIVKPIEQFVQKIDASTDESRITEGMQLNIHGYQEIEQLSASFNKMSEKIQRLLDNVKSKEEKLRNAEIEALIAQLNPHFIYNTLFSIKCTIQMNKPDDACQMLSLLITILRFGIGDPKSDIRLSEEIYSLDTYIALQKYRYGNQLNFSYSIPASLTNCVIPKNILQPIVENSITHGIEPRGTAGNIHISAGSEGEDLILDIYDDGVGIAVGLDTLFSDQDSSSHHIGLKNVQSRIHLNYGSHYGLNIVPTKAGTCIRIRLPKLF